MSDDVFILLRKVQKADIQIEDAKKRYGKDSDIVAKLRIIRRAYFLEAVGQKTKAKKLLESVDS